MQGFVDFLLKIFNGNIILCVICFALIPVIEIRGAIPLGINLGLNIFQSALFSLIGSVFCCAFLLFVMPLIFRLLEKTKLYNKFICVISPKIEKLKEKNINIYVALMFFVLIPLPLTGVTTACIIASMLNLNKFKSFIFITIGNIIASIIISLTALFLGDYSLIITLVFMVAFIFIALIYIFKFLKN